MKTPILSMSAAVLTLFATCWTPLSAATLSLTVSDNYSDGCAWGTTLQNTTADYALAGYSTNGVPYYIAAFRFFSLHLPRGTTIDSAYLRIQAYNVGSGSSTFTVVGEAYDNPSSYYYDPKIALRATTTAQVTWSVASAWVMDGIYTSPDIKTVVQEIVNRAGWESGNAVAIQLRNAASSGGAQMIFSKEGADYWGGNSAELIINYTEPADGVKSENFIPGATNSPSLVPTYLNDPTMYYPAGAGGICWATATADILAYWDRNAYAGVKYWKLIDNGTAPLLQPTQPAAPGHDQAFVSNVVAALAYQYYGLERTDEDVMIEELTNLTNGLAFNVTYHPGVQVTASRSNYLNTIKSASDAGRPVGIGSYGGDYFGGPHQIPCIGYRIMSNVVNSTIYIHLNTGGTENQHANPFASSWGYLDMDQIVPGGTPVDEYEAIGDNTSASTVGLLPDHLYEFRQTHNFSFAGDADWVQISVVSNRRYTIWTTNLGTSADTLLTLFANDGTTQLEQDDNGGGEARASKIVWNGWSNGTVRLRATDAAGGSGHAANYDLQVAYAAGASPSQASGPSPAHLATGVATNAAPSWTAGAGATGYRVNFGTSVAPPFVRNQAATTFSTNLASGTTYYWRIDPTNVTGVTTGDVWQFTTAAVASEHPAVLADANFGVLTNQFGFNMNWDGGRTVVVDACTNPVNPIWVPLQTNVFSGTAIYFFDARWTNFTKRYYRIREAP